MTYYRIPVKRASWCGDSSGMQNIGRHILHRTESEVTRDEAVQVGVESLAAWHDREHGLRCTCAEGERIGYQAEAVVDALTAEGAVFEPYQGPGPERF